MTKRTVKDLDVAGKKVIVRCDFNVPRKDGVITDDNRIVMALPTIKYLVENKAKVILMSHLGKVKTEEDKAKNNLECVAVRLQELLPDVKVTFCPVTRGEELENAVNALADGEIVLMQNTRYEKGESKNDPELGAYWASLGEVFVEDAFGSVHRAHASTVGIPTNIKENGLGFLVEKEVTMLGKAVDEPAHPFVAIIGGSKVSSKIDVVDNLLKKADKVIIGGGMAYTFSKAVGGSIGTSLVEDDKLDLALDLMKKAKEKGICITYIDSCTTEELQDLTVATDNVEAGRRLGEYARTIVGKDDKIAVISHVKGVSTAVEREQGFREGLGDYEKNIVEVVYCNSLFDRSYNLAKELMEKYPDLKMIAGMNEYSSVGAARAVKEAEAKDRIATVGIDSSQEAVQLMEQGVFKAFVVQKAFKMGYLGVKETILHLEGKKEEKNIDSGCELITPENMYNSEMEKLLFPFNTKKNT